MKNLNEIVYRDSTDPNLKEFINDKLIPDLLEWSKNSRYDFSIIPFLQSQGITFDFILSLSKEFKNLKNALQTAFDKINSNFCLTMHDYYSPASFSKSIISFPSGNNEDKVPASVIVFEPYDENVIPKKNISTN